MSEQTLKTYLRISGWSAILASFVIFAVSMIERNMRFIETGMDVASQNYMNVSYVLGFGIQLPLTFTLACLCLVAARVMTYETQTLKTIFE